MKSKILTLKNRVIKFFLSSRKNIILSSFYILFWLFLGSLDSFIFHVGSESEEDSRLFLRLIEFNWYFITPQESEKFIPWIRDNIGHWLAIFSIIASITLYKAIKNLEEFSKNLHTQIFSKVENIFFIWIIVVFILSTVYIYQNYDYVMNISKKVHWQKEISPFLTLIIPTVFYYVILFPLIISVLYYMFLLNYITRHIEMIKEFNILHRDQMFGLRIIGKSIFWNIVVLSILAFPVLIIQIRQKGDFSLGNFITTFVVLSLFWQICVKPILNLSDKLSEIKSKSYGAVKNIVQKLQQSYLSIENVNSKDIKNKLTRAEEQEKFIDNLKVIPLTMPEIIFGTLAVFGLLTLVAIGVVFLNY